MKPYQYLLCVLCLLGTVMADQAAAQTTAAVPPTRVDNDANTRKGFDDFYNLEYDKAIHEFEAAQQAHPNDPFAVNHLLAAIVFKELKRIGALDTESYAGDSFLTRKLLAPRAYSALRFFGSLSSCACERAVAWSVNCFTRSRVAGSSGASNFLVRKLSPA